MSRKLRIPAASSDGAVMTLTGSYARHAVLAAFQAIGGVERLAEWADENPGEFYKSIFSKTITRESEVNHTVGIENELDALEHLDDAIDADFDIVEDDGD